MAARQENALNDWLPWLDRQGRFSALRAVAFAAVLAPALLLAFDAWTGSLGSKPWTQAVHDAGTWTVRLLVLTLAVSPARRIFGWSRVISVRRMLGLAVMAYALGHFALYCIDLGFHWGLIVSEIVKRFYLLIGFVALLGLVALGVTSTDAMIRRLGGRNWQRLHDLVYPITLLGLLHFALQSKIDVTQPALMTGLFLLLMAYRGLNRLKLPMTAPMLAMVAIAAGLATALAEAAWYGLATGVPATAVLQANADILIDQDPGAVRPAHWVALAGLLAALVRAVHVPKSGASAGRRATAALGESR